MNDVYVVIGGKKYHSLSVNFRPDGEVRVVTHRDFPISETKKNFSIKNVIFNPPATIVFWNDNTKTVVKAQNGEEFDPEKGLAMAILKRIAGNKGRYYNVFAKWCKNYKVDEKIELPNIDLPNPITEAIKKISDILSKMEYTNPINSAEFYDKLLNENLKSE